MFRLPPEFLDPPLRAPVDEIRITGDRVHAFTAEGACASMPLEDWMARLRPPPPDHAGMVLPDGVRAVVTHPSGRGMVWVSEIPPRVWSVDWLAPDSPSDFGPGTRYLRRSLAFPYQVLLTTFSWGPFEGGAGLCLNRRRVELFWRRGPLATLDDDLRYPALLNVTKFLRESDPGFQPKFRTCPLSWLCTQHLVQTPDMKSGNPAVRLRAGHGQVLELLAGQSFNRSSEHHPGDGEQMSWYSWSVRQGVDPRIADIGSWEAASREDPLWVLDVDWLPVEWTLRGVIDRIFHTTLELPAPDQYRHAADLGRLVFQHVTPPRPTPADSILAIGIP